MATPFRFGVKPEFTTNILLEAMTHGCSEIRKTSCSHDRHDTKSQVKGQSNSLEAEHGYRESGP